MKIYLNGNIWMGSHVTREVSLRYWGMFVRDPNDKPYLLDEECNYPNCIICARDGIHKGAVHILNRVLIW